MIHALAEPPIPPPHPAWHQAHRDDGLLLSDPDTGRRVQLGVQSAAVWAALAGGHRTPSALRAALPHLRPAVVRGRLLQLAQSGLLQEAHGGPPPPRPATAPLPGAPVHLDPRLRHACVGCGSSCVGVVVAPVGESTLASLVAHPLPGVAAPVVDAGGLPGLARHHEGCVALTAEARCALHAQDGPEAKPDPCRLFPYFLVRTPRGLRAGLGAECRSLPASLAAGAAPEAEDPAPGLAALAPYAVPVPDPAPLWPEVWWSAADLEAAADAWLATADPLAAAVATVQAALATPGPTRPWLDLGWWPGAEPPSRRAARAALLEALGEAAAASAQDARGRDEPFAAERAVLVGQAVAALAGDLALPPTHLAPEAPAALAAAAVGAIAGLEFAVRRDGAWGLARLRLHLALAAALASVRAAQVARAVVRADDVVDGLVATSLFLRSPRAETALGLHAAALRACWLDPAELDRPWVDALGAPP